MEETIEIVLHCAKLVNFCYQSNYLMVDGERVTYRAKTRYGNLFGFKCVLIFYNRKEKKKGEMEIENSNKFLCATGVDKYRRKPCKFGPNRMGTVIAY